MNYQTINLLDELKSKRLGELSLPNLRNLMDCYLYYVYDEHKRESFKIDLSCLFDKIKRDNACYLIINYIYEYKNKFVAMMMKYWNQKNNYEEHYKALSFYELYETLKYKVETYYYKDSAQVIETKNLIEQFISDGRYKLYLDFIEYQRNLYIELINKYIDYDYLNWIDYNCNVNIVFNHDETKEYYTCNHYDNYIETPTDEYYYEYTLSYNEFSSKNFLMKLDSEFLDNFNNILLGVIIRYIKYGFFLGVDEISKINNEYNSIIRFKNRFLNDEKTEYYYLDIPKINIFKPKSRLDTTKYEDISYTDYMQIVFKYMKKDLDLLYDIIIELEKFRHERDKYYPGDNGLQDYYKFVENHLRTNDKQNRLKNVSFKN